MLLFGIMFTNNYVKLNILLSIYDIIYIPYNLQLKITGFKLFYLRESLFVESNIMVVVNIVLNHFIALVILTNKTKNEIDLFKIFQ